MPATRETLVVLTILDDANPTREWWEAIGLPDPARWSLPETFDVFVLPKLLAERVTRGHFVAEPGLRPGFRRDTETGEVAYSSEWLS